MLSEKPLGEHGHRDNLFKDPCLVSRQRLNERVTYVITTQAK